MNIDIVTKMLDRYGLPTIILGAIFWIAYRLVMGPITRLATALGDGITTIAKEVTAWMANLTSSLEKSRIEHVEMRLHVSTEVATLREHVSDEVGKLRDRLSSSENLLSGEVRAVTGSFAAISTRTPPMGIPAAAKAESHHTDSTTTVAS
jgi:hypothetical protein